MAQRGGNRLVKYRQIADDLRARIERGEWPVGGQIPTLPELADHYGAAKGTVAKALDMLHDLGLAETMQGMGTFVRTPSKERGEYEMVIERVDALAEELRLLRERVESVERQRGAASGLSRRVAARGRGPRSSARQAERGLLPAVPPSSAP